MMTLHRELTSLSDERAIKMRYLLVVLSVLALWVPVAQAHDDAAAAAAAAEYRLLRAENRILKAQLAALKKRFGLGPATTPTTKPAATQPTTQPSTQPTTQPAKAGATRTFAIHDNEPTWWTSPAALTFEVRLREILAATAPADATAPWLIRNKYLVGNTLDWNVKIMSTSSVSETEAGRQYYATRDAAERLRKRIDEATASLAGLTDPNIRAYEERSIADNRVALAATEAQNRRWKRALDLKGATVLEAIYREKRKSRLVPVLSVMLVLPADERDKLTKYETARRAKMPRTRRMYCPVNITGEVDAVVYDGNLIRVDVKGKWGDVPIKVAPGAKPTVKPGPLKPGKAAGPPARRKR